MPFFLLVFIFVLAIAGLAVVIAAVGAVRALTGGQYGRTGFGGIRRSWNQRHRGSDQPHHPKTRSGHVRHGAPKKLHFGGGGASKKW